MITCDILYKTCSSISQNPVDGFIDIDELDIDNTASQIVQHILSLHTIYSVSQQMGCEQNNYGNISDFLMYSMYSDLV